MSPAKMAYVPMDTVDPGQIAPFWSEMLGVSVASTVVVGPTSLKQTSNEDAASA